MTEIPNHLSGNKGEKLATDKRKFENFQPVSDRVPLSQKVVAQITEAITNGAFLAGDRLPTERELALQLGVSRTAIRDAIKLLAGQGLLVVTHGSGIFVASQELVADRLAALLTIRQGTLAELFEIRKLIEVEAAGWAARRGTPEQLEKLQAVVASAIQALDDPVALARYDVEFHVGVSAAAHNGVLLRIMLNLLDLLAEGRQESLRIPGRPARSAGEHAQILAAILERDATAARQQMWQHLDSVEHSVIAGQK